MNRTANKEAERVAKVSKSLLLHEDLSRLVQAIEERSGLSFTRVLTAALLAFLFESFENPEPAKGHGPDIKWIRLVVLLERGQLSVADIPLAMLDDWIGARERYIKSCEQDQKPDKTFIARLHQELADVEEIRRRWANRVEDFGPMEALIDAVQSSWLG